MVHQRSCDITDDDLLTWEVQLRREGTLPPEVQERLLGMVRNLCDEIDDPPRGDTYFTRFFKPPFRGN